MGVIATAASGASSPPGLAEAGACLQSGDNAGAVTILRDVTAREPDNARAWRMLGYVCIQTDALNDAITAYEKLLTLAPETPQAFWNLGLIYARKHDADRALTWLGRAKATAKLDMSALATDTTFASMRDDPRFQALLPRPEDFADPFVEDVTILHEWDGEAANDQFGWIARNVGDVDGDGVADVVTSAPTHATGGKDAGRVYVFSTRSGALVWQADGEAGDRLGTGLEAAGDTDGDGTCDVIAGAPGGGSATVFSGRDGRVLLRLPAEAKDDAFGRHTDGTGDVDGDGHADVIIGAPGNDAGGEDAGRAYLYSGADGHLLMTWTGERAGDGFGSTVAGASDGEHTFLVVGAPKAGPNRTGRVSVYDDLSAQPRFTIESDETGQGLGLMFVSVPGDVDGDGVPDIYASDWGNAAKGPSTGRVYVYSGRDGRPLLTLTGETAGEGFGTCPAVAGDVDGDGHADLIVGAWQYAGGAVSGGRAYLYSGADASLVRTYTCRTPGDTFGFDAVGLGDVDGDGTIDFLITSGWSGVHGFHSGRVFVISSGVKAKT